MKAVSLVVVAVVALVASWLWAERVRAVRNVVAGVVRDPAGQPISSVWIARDGYKDRVGLTPWWRTDADGRFRVEGVSAGELALRVAPGEASLLDGTLVRTTAGTLDLAIVVEPGPQALLRIADYEAAEGPPRHARLLWSEPEGRRPVRASPIASDGRVRFIRLPKDATFELWGSAGPNRPVRAAGLRVGDREVRVEAKTGARITGRVLWSKRDMPTRAQVIAYAYPGFDVASVSPTADGSFTFEGLPEGTYDLVGGFFMGEVSTPVRVAARTGTSDVVLDLRR